MPGRIWILPISAVVISALCIYKWTRDDRADEAAPSIQARCAATSFKFELFDQKMRRVRLERYLGRHRILLVFYDGNAGAERDSVLLRLRKLFPEVERQGIIVLGISTALPQENRPIQRGVGSRFRRNHPQRPFPFELLTDNTRSSDVHRSWGRYDRVRNRPTTGTFLIDRAGRVSCERGIPKPLPDPQQTIDELLAG